MGVVAGQYMIPSDFSKRIKLLRQNLGLSRRDLAELLDVSLTLVKQWESGRLQPSVQEWQLIALAESGGIAALSKNNLKQNVFRETEIRYETEPDIAPSIIHLTEQEARHRSRGGRNASPCLESCLGERYSWVGFLLAE